MSNLSNTLLEMLGQGQLEQLSQQVGADPETTQRAVRTALPLLLSALGQKATQPQEAEALANAIQKDHDGSVLDRLPELMAQGKLDQEGEKILRHVLGEKRPVVEQGLAQTAGLDPNSTGKLLAMLAPVVLGALGKTQREQQLDATGLASLLIHEKREASSELGGLASLLDMDGDGDYKDDLINMGGKLLGRFFG